MFDALYVPESRAIQVSLKLKQVFEEKTKVSYKGKSTIIDNTIEEKVKGIGIWTNSNGKTFYRKIIGIKDIKVSTEATKEEIQQWKEKIEKKKEGVNIERCRSNGISRNYCINARG